MHMYMEGVTRVSSARVRRAARPRSAHGFFAQSAHGFFRDAGTHAALRASSRRDARVRTSKDHGGEGGRAKGHSHEDNVRMTALLLVQTTAPIHFLTDTVCVNTWQAAAQGYIRRAGH